MNLEITPGKVAGTVKIPPSKSLAHRALICAGLSAGISRLTNYAPSKDMKATISCMSAMGASYSIHDDTVLVRGTAKPEPKGILDAGESGSTLRFLIPVAATSSLPAAFAGHGRLMERPMGVYADLFANQNLVFDQGRKLIVQGPLKPGLFTVDGSVSSQFISGLLFAAPLMDGQSEIAVLPPYESKSYVGLTLEMLETFGIQVQTPTEDGYIIPGNQAFKAQDLAIEGDWSQAAFFGVLAAIHAPLTLTGLHKDSGQGDKVIVDFLQKAGAKIHWDGDELHVAPGTLHSFEADLQDCPDLGPILFVLASFCPGTSTFKNAGRLRIKESDRIQAMEEQLRKWGVNISSTETEVTIQGKPVYNKQDVIADGCNDHRIVMAMSVFALCAQTKSALTGAQAVSKSYPGFFEDLKQIGANV
jgi:3-phosphoshikimate 1-carboxyvinyltransferase